MNILVMYDSYFINTNTVAEAIADSFTQKGSNVELERLYQVDFFNLEKIDLLVVGAPTHNHGMPKPVKSVLKKLPRGILTGKLVLSFDTRYKKSVRKSGSAARGINKLLTRLGGTPIAPPESFFVQERRGPLFPGELARASQWAAELLAQEKV